MAEAAKPPTNCLDIAVRILAGVLVLIIATLITIWTDSLPCRLLAYAAVAVGLTAFLLKQFRVLTGATIMLGLAPITLTMLNCAGVLFSRN